MLTVSASWCSTVTAQNNHSVNYYDYYYMSIIITEWLEVKRQTRQMPSNSTMWCKRWQRYLNVSMTMRLPLILIIRLLCRLVNNVYRVVWILKYILSKYQMWGVFASRNQRFSIFRNKRLGWDKFRLHQCHSSCVYLLPAVTIFSMRHDVGNKAIISYIFVTDSYLYFLAHKKTNISYNVGI